MGWVGLKRMILRHRGSVLRRSFLTGVFFSERQDRRKNFKPDKKKWNAKVFAFFLQLNVKLKPSALSVPHCLFRLAARMENRLGQTETGDFHGKVRTWKDWQIESSSDFALHFSTSLQLLLSVLCNEWFYTPHRYTRSQKAQNAYPCVRTST